MQVLHDPEQRLWRQISLELTESHFARPEAVAALEELAALGYAIALDDFGTGYSALAAIHTLPVSIVKVDRSFIDRLPYDAPAEALVAAISGLCQQLAITVVAEGIETHEQAKSVRDLGCQIGQGFLLARPQPLDAFQADVLKPRDLTRAPRRPRNPEINVGDAALRHLLALHEQGASATSIAAALNRSGYRGRRWHSLARPVSAARPRRTASEAAPTRLMPHQSRAGQHLCCPGRD